MNKEQFKETDIVYYDSFNKHIIEAFNKTPFDLLLKVNNNSTDIDIPAVCFDYLLHTRSHRIERGLSVNVSYFDSTDDDNYWLKHTNYLGVIYPENNLFDLKLRKGVEHSTLSLLWILLHEYRHYVQSSNMAISSCVENENLRLFREYLEQKGNSQSTIEHVLHEILPYEVDANVFACEILGIEYPSSKFVITPYTMQMLK